MKMDHSLSQCTCSLTDAKQECYWNRGAYSGGGLIGMRVLTLQGHLPEQGPLLKKKIERRGAQQRGDDQWNEGAKSNHYDTYKYVGCGRFSVFRQILCNSTLKHHYATSSFNAIKTVLYQQPNAVLRCQSFFHSSPNGANQKGSSIKVREMFPSRVQTEKTPTALMKKKVNKTTSSTMLFQFFLAFLTAALNNL